MCLEYTFQDVPNELHVEDDRGIWALNDKMKQAGEQHFYINAPLIQTNCLNSDETFVCHVFVNI